MEAAPSRARPLARRAPETRAATPSATLEPPPPALVVIDVPGVGRVAVRPTTLLDGPGPVNDVVIALHNGPSQEALAAIVLKHLAAVFLGHQVINTRPTALEDVRTAQAPVPVLAKATLPVQVAVLAKMALAPADVALAGDKAAIGPPGHIYAGAKATAAVEAAVLVAVIYGPLRPPVARLALDRVPAELTGTEEATWLTLTPGSFRVAAPVPIMDALHTLAPIFMALLVALGVVAPGVIAAVARPVAGAVVALPKPLALVADLLGVVTAVGPAVPVPPSVEVAEVPLPLIRPAAAAVAIMAAARLVVVALPVPRPLPRPPEVEAAHVAPSGVAAPVEARLAVE